ncbi:MAG TPA: porin [Verrucomicrobiae bacterium]
MKLKNGAISVWLALGTVLPAIPAMGADDSARIQELERRLQELDQKYRVLERRLEIEGEAATEKAKTAPSMSIGAQGFSYRSADTNFVLKIRGLLQADSRFYIDDGGNNRNDTFLIRRARPIIEATLWDNIDLTLVPEFGGGSNTADGNPTSSASILDAYANIRYSPELQLRVGKFKSPVGLEQLQSDSQAYFMERGLPSSLTPNRDVGLMLHGEVFDGVVNYQAAVLNGVGDNRNSPNLDIDDDKDVAARLFFHPFQKLDIEALQGLGVGIAGTSGNHDGVQGINSYGTEGAQTYFSYNPQNATVRADGTAWRLTPQAYYYWRSLGLIGEYVVSSQEVRASASNTNGVSGFGELQHKAWQIVGGYVLTGEDASFRGVNPKKPFSLASNQWGAWEVVARYSHLDIDDEAFPIFSNPSTSATEAHGYGFGINWYANRNVRTSLNYIHTDFKGGENGTVTREDENAVLTRLQLAF